MRIIARKIGLCLAAILVICCRTPVQGQGFLLDPENNRFSEVSLNKHSVNITVTDLKADFEIVQELKSTSSYPVTGDFYFAIPKNAVTSNLIVTIDGTAGNTDILGYEEIFKFLERAVKGTDTPALLSLLDYNLFRCNISPITPKKQLTIKTKYTQKLSELSGYTTLEYPVLYDIWQDIDEDAVSRQQPLRLSLLSHQWLTGVYSPDYHVQTDQKGPSLILVQTDLNVKPQDTFTLFYSQSEEFTGMSLLTHKLTTDAYGYFMLTCSTPAVLPVNRILSKDVILVVDISKSMEGAKLKHAKEALKKLISSLNEDDYFNVIAFNSDSRLFRKQLVQVKGNREDGRKFVGRLRAKGGTNIHEAMLSALAHSAGSKGPRNILLITDGKPTVGLTDSREINENIVSLNKMMYRIYTFGIGYDVDCNLLNGIAGDNHGSVCYVESGDNIESALQNFYRSIANPFLTSLQLSFSDVEIFDVYPEKLPELVAGGSFSVIGRYKGSFNGIAELTGRSSNGITKSNIDLYFPEFNEDNDFLTSLWAMRKMGGKLQQVKGQQYSDIVLTDILKLTEFYALLNPFSAKHITGNTESHLATLLHLPVSRMLDNNAMPPADAFETAESGKKAVQVSKYINHLKSNMLIREDPASGIRRIGEQNFALNESGYWIDWLFEPGDDLLHIRYASTAYFQLLHSYPSMAGFMKLGKRLIFKCENKFVQIDDDGIDELTEEMLNNLYSKLQVQSSPETVND